MSLLSRIIRDQIHYEKVSFQQVQPLNIEKVLHEVFSDKVYHIARYVTVFEFIHRLYHIHPKHGKHYVQQADRFFKQSPHPRYIFILDLYTYGPFTAYTRWLWSHITRLFMYFM